MSTSSMRLNARIDAALARKVKALQVKTKSSVTDVVRAAIELYYGKVMAETEAIAALRSSGFVGCAEGPADLSGDYKRHLAVSLDRKRR